MNPLFNVGDTVKAKAYTDCFGVYHPDSKPLIVTRVYPIVNETAPHVRVTARPNGYSLEEYDACQDCFTLVAG